MQNSKNDTIYKELGMKLRTARENLQYTQAETAGKAGIHVNYYARVERGEENPTYEILHRVLKVLKIKSLEV